MMFEDAKMSADCRQITEIHTHGHLEKDGEKAGDFFWGGGKGFDRVEQDPGVIGQLQNP